jgi:hypothetical protein
MTGRMRRVAQYALNPFLDSAMCWLDPFVVGRFVAWVDREDIEKTWEYISEHRQQHTDLPAFSDQVMHDIADTKGVSYRAVDRWLSHCLYEARKPAGEKRGRMLHFID